MLLELEGIEWRVSRRAGVWRYSSMLPGLGARVSLGEGLTPVRRLAGALAKLEVLNPTGSYADRASSLVASYVSSAGLSRVEAAYSEDYSYSLATYLKGVARVRVYVGEPSRVDADEVIALAELGAEVRVGPPPPGALTYMDSLAVEGLKTIAFEIVERGVEADEIVVPAETGLLALAVAKGVREAERAGAPRGYSVVAVALEGAPRPVLAEAAGLRVEAVEPGDAVKALFSLARRGVRAKLLSAAAYHAAEGRRAVAVITSARPRLKPRLGRARMSALKEKVLQALGRLGEATAYGVWEEVGGYSLKGVYKALDSLEREGLVCSRYVAEGARKKKLFRLCSPAHHGSTR
jgi:hypothetical protein